MCPACVASTAWIVAGVSSTGGLTALAAKLLRSKNGVEKAASKENYEQELKHDQTIKEK